MKPTPAALARVAATARARMEVRWWGAEAGCCGASAARRARAPARARRRRAPGPPPTTYRPPPPEGDRDRGQRQTGEQRPDRGAGLLRAEGEAVPARVDGAPQQRAHRRAADRVAEPRDEQDRDQDCRGMRERSDREAGNRGERRPEEHPPARPDSLDQVAGRGRAQDAGQIEDRHGEPEDRVAEGEVVADPGGEARGEEARQHAGDDQGRAGRDRSTHSAAACRCCSASAPT